MSNRRDIQFMYNPHNKATVLDCSFVVSAGNSSGKGISSLSKSGRIANVFMKSSASFAGDTHTNKVIDNIASTASLSVGMLLQSTHIPAGTFITAITSATAIAISNATSGTAGGETITYAAVGSPQPQSGIIIVQLQDNYNSYLSSYGSLVSPLSGSSINISGGSVLTIGNVYVIKTLGTSTQANWVAVGLSPNIAAAVGVSFIASVTGGGTGTGTVQAPAAAGSAFGHIELIGSSSLANNSQASNILGSGVGMQLIMGCYSSSAVLTMNSYTPAGVITNGVPDTFAGTPATLTGSVAMSYALAAPADNTNIALNIYLNNSAQGV